MQRWEDAAQRLAEPYERIIGEQGPWPNLATDLRQALLAGEPDELNALLEQRAGVRRDGYQRTRKRFRDAVPTPRPADMLTTARDPAAIAMRAAGILQSLPEQPGESTVQLPTQSSSQTLVLDWQRTLLSAVPEEPGTPRLMHRAAGINAMPDALRAVPDYQQITAAVARPVWFTLPLTGQRDRPDGFDASALRELWLEGGNDSPLVGDDATLPDLLAPIGSSLNARDAWIATNEASRLIREIVPNPDLAPTDRAIDDGLRKTVRERYGHSRLGDDPFNGVPIPITQWLEVLGLEPTRELVENIAAFDPPAIAELRHDIERARAAIGNAALDRPTADLLTRIAARLDALHDQSRAFWLALPERLADSAERGRAEMPIFASALASTDWPKLRAALAPWLVEREYPVGRYQQALHAVLTVHNPDDAAAFRALSDGPTWQAFIDAMTLARRGAGGSGDWAEQLTDLARQLVKLGDTPPNPAASAESLLPRDGILMSVPTSRRVIEHIRAILADTPAGSSDE